MRLDGESPTANFEDRANRLAHNLLEAGLTTGSHIGVHLHNSIETVETLLAAFKIRAVPININYRYTSDELAYVYGNADLEAVVHHRVYSPRIAEVLPSLPKIRYTVVVEDDLGGVRLHSDSVPYEEALSGSGRRDFGERSNDDVFIMYTGGTTGRPKVSCGRTSRSGECSPAASTSIPVRPSKTNTSSRGWGPRASRRCGSRCRR